MTSSETLTSVGASSRFRAVPRPAARQGGSGPGPCSAPPDHGRVPRSLQLSCLCPLPYTAAGSSGVKNCRLHLPGFLYTSQNNSALSRNRLAHATEMGVFIVTALLASSLSRARRAEDCPLWSLESLIDELTSSSLTCVTGKLSSLTWCLESRELRSQCERWDVNTRRSCSLQLH